MEKRESKQNRFKDLFKRYQHKEKAVLNKSLPSITLKDYTKKFKSFVATKSMNFTVGQGVIHGFIGPNGAGKTTAIKAMIGAYRPTSGSVSINGHKAGSANANRLIGYIPERASFPSHLTTIKYLTTMAELSGLSPRDAKEKSVQMLKKLGLFDQANRKPFSFSSGMQKKILLAQSLIIEPSVLILDEPAANLDPTARKELFDNLISLRKEGKTILISSHILAELERLIDEVTFVYYGEIIYSGTIKDLTNQQSDVFIKSSDNIVLAKKLKDKGYAVSGDIQTEVVVKNQSSDKVKGLFKFLSTLPERITSFRANDLQSIYDHFIEKSEKERRGKQSLKGKRIVSMKTKKLPEKKGVLMKTKKPLTTNKKLPGGKK